MGIHINGNIYIYKWESVRFVMFQEMWFKNTPVPCFHAFTKSLFPGDEIVMFTWLHMTNIYNTHMWTIDWIWFTYNVYVYIYILVGGLEHLDYFPFHIWDVTLPNLTNSFFSRWLKPPARYIPYIFHIYIFPFIDYITYNLYIPYIYIYTYVFYYTHIHKHLNPSNYLLYILLVISTSSRIYVG